MHPGAPHSLPDSTPDAQRAVGRPAGRTWRGRWELFLGGLLLMFGMAYFGSALLANYLEQRRVMSQYLPIEGLVYGAEVVALPGASPSSSAYAVRLHCRYSWKGEEHVSTTDVRGAGGHAMDFRDATATAAAFEAGTPTRFYADPDDPAHVVSVDSEPRSLAPALFLLVLAAASAFLAAVGWRGWPLVVRSTHG